MFDLSALQSVWLDTFRMSQSVWADTLRFVMGTAKCLDGHFETSDGSRKVSRGRLQVSLVESLRDTHTLSV